MRRPWPTLGRSAAKKKKLFTAADELIIVLPMVHVYVVEYSNLHEKCPPKLNVIIL